MINHKGENYKDELDLAEEELEKAMERFAVALAKISYAEGVEDSLDLLSPNQSEIAWIIRKELLE